MRMQVTPDYWHYVSWRASHRLFSSMLGIFATQSLLSAVGIGAQRSLPAAAAINWVLKDGLGRLGRLGVAAAFGQSFDADVKVVCCFLAVPRLVLSISLGTSGCSYVGSHRLHVHDVVTCAILLSLQWVWLLHVAALNARANYLHTLPSLPSARR